MEFKELIEITPEIEAEAKKLLEAARKLETLIGSKGRFDLATYTAAPNRITIFDRHEYSRDGLGHDLGFFVHRIFEDGSVVLDFIAEDNEEAQEFEREFNEFMEAENE